jgi:hypothetical protein
VRSAREGVSSVLRVRVIDRVVGAMLRSSVSFPRLVRIGCRKTTMPLAWSGHQSAEKAQSRRRLGVRGVDLG